MTIPPVCKHCFRSKSPCALRKWSDGQTLWISKASAHPLQQLGYMKLPFQWLLGIGSMLLKMSDHLVDYSLGSLCHLKANILIFLNNVGRAGKNPIFITPVIKRSRPGWSMYTPGIWSFWLSVKFKCLFYCGLIICFCNKISMMSSVHQWFCP